MSREHPSKRKDAGVQALVHGKGAVPPIARQGRAPAERRGPPRGAYSECPNVFSYGFTLQANLTQTFIGEIPGGFRVDLQYEPRGSVALSFDGFLADLRDMLEPARLLSGNDWVSVSANGLASFDTRISLQVGPPSDDPDERCVIGGNICGRVDLINLRNEAGEPIFDQHERPENIIAAWQKGFADGSFLPLALSAVFDIPVKGSDRDQNRIYQRCRPLGQSTFVVFGRATYAFGQNSPLDSISLDFVRAEIPPAALRNFGEEALERRHLLHET